MAVVQERIGTIARMEFHAAERVSLSLEWDVALVDPNTGELTGRAGEILDAVDEPRCHPGFMTNTICMVTETHRNVPGAIADLRSLCTKVVRAADDAGIGVIGLGTHPFSDWHVQAITPDAQGIQLVERAKEWSRQLAVWGLRVRIAVGDSQAIPAATRGVLNNYHWLLAPTASSPYWIGQNTGFVSHRSMLMRQVPGAGLPTVFDTWAETVQAVEGMCRAGVIANWRDLDWTIRPEPARGGIGLNIADSQPSLFNVGAHAALVQCVVEEALRAHERGESTDNLPIWAVRENKFRAARFGFDTQVVTDAAGNQTPAREGFARRIDELQHIARDLGCEGELVSCLILLDSTPAERQRAMLRGGNRNGVIESLRSELLR